MGDNALTSLHQGGGGHRILRDENKDERKKEEKSEEEGEKESNKGAKNREQRKKKGAKRVTPGLCMKYRDIQGQQQQFQGQPQQQFQGGQPQQFQVLI